MLEMNKHLFQDRSLHFFLTTQGLVFQTSLPVLHMHMHSLTCGDTKMNHLIGEMTFAEWKKGNKVRLETGTLVKDSKNFPTKPQTFF